MTQPQQMNIQDLKGDPDTAISVMAEQVAQLTADKAVLIGKIRVLYADNQELQQIIAESEGKSDD